MKDFKKIDGERYWELREEFAGKSYFWADDPNLDLDFFNQLSYFVCAAQDFIAEDCKENGDDLTEEGKKICRDFLEKKGMDSEKIGELSNNEFIEFYDEFTDFAAETDCELIKGWNDEK